MNSKLKDKRIAAYEEATNYKLLSRVPLIISINGRSFSKLSGWLDKPFSPKFAECMYSALMKLVHEIDGAIFGYSFNDEIIIITRNDQNLETEPWYENNVQKIASVASSLATLQFNNYANAIDLNTIGDAVFVSHVYVVPNINEAMGIIVSKQQKALQSSMYFSCFYELLKKYDKNEIKEILSNTSMDDKINILKQECNVDFNEYPLAFRRGVATYRSLSVRNHDNEIIRKKWNLNMEVPIFTSDHSFLKNIFHSGYDILRQENT